MKNHNSTLKVLVQSTFYFTLWLIIFLISRNYPLDPFADFGYIVFPVFVFMLVSILEVVRNIYFPLDRKIFAVLFVEYCLFYFIAIWHYKLFNIAALRFFIYSFSAIIASLLMYMILRTTLRNSNKLLIIIFCLFYCAAYCFFIFITWYDYTPIFKLH